VRLPAKLTAASVMLHPSCCLAGRSALPQTEEGRVIMESLRRILAQTSEAPHVTEEDGT
jgi:hypothetical protein